MNTERKQPLDQDALEKIRQQFDHSPYPRIALETSPKDDYDTLYIHSLVTSYYLKHRRVTETTGKVILDAGCGSGYKSLILAEANPGAKIVGIDLSEKSVELAEKRLKHHGFDNAVFYAMSIYDLPQLNLQFDYINCDEVLYLLPDPLAGLQAMKAVLKPEGLIRTNLHNAYQRSMFYRAQNLFKLMGLMDNIPQEMEEEAVFETMKSLKPGVKLRQEAWGSEYNSSEMTEDRRKELLYSNHLLVGDKGFTIPDMFALLHQSKLELVSMVNWRQWDVTELFQKPDDLPALWAMGLERATIEEKLRLYELLNPMHRLMDFWCGHPSESAETIPSTGELLRIEDWSNTDWQGAIVHLHPQLRIEAVKEKLLDCINRMAPFEISRFIPLPALKPIYLESTSAACLLPLWESAQPIQALAERFLQMRPVNPATLEPLTITDAFDSVKQLLDRLEPFLYVLLEC
ncbi:class I SAM-dependent methyltransferase [Leptolyngbya sp. ST-U4]|uniref:class I SAM-dependent methyltransferase n=1 Tax=Leptolyngbya sp. ST-U4 TaxID=2933912 RepID=UPI0019C3C55E|nr:class I SAM-dependent methyltransferase [Cyanobacteria bacterium FACHB-502]